MEFGFSIGSCFKAENLPVLISVIDCLYNKASDFIFLIIKLFQEKYSTMTGLDEKTELQMLAFKSSKIRLLRSMAIENETMRLLIFCIVGFLVVFFFCVCIMCRSLTFQVAWLA
ncbi:unnamed protein product [Arabidopsis lyrata]|uniref:Uncharacterized protein n=1 Tax=Arabidopsis lyrata subsp. lyrata TaxID=81972 RepID=D7KEU1_ARALL|nr:hypothetical protein ARALYDRAFT_890583 [Arabidopsis lyrata subsp. lyrata]CAH8253973.1 unnamed protein product [Arabidopsis lyrata]